MSEFTMDRLRENLESLKMKNTLEILDNYLERAVAENLNIVDVLDHIFSEEAKSKRKRAYEKQIQMSGFPIQKTLDDFDFSFQPSIDKRQIDELATMRFLENGENVVFRPGVKSCVSENRQNQEEVRWEARRRRAVSLGRLGSRRAGRYARRRCECRSVCRDILQPGISRQHGRRT